MDGNEVFDRLCIAGSVWGGLTYQMGFPDGRLVGIVCPEVTILLDVLDDPMRIAEHGLGKGMMSLHEDSVPVLPRDPLHGAIFAGNPNPNEVYTTVSAPMEQTRQSEVSKVIFTWEPFAQANAPLSAIICGWESGDVAFELDVGSRFDWQVVAAGLVFPKHAMMVVDEDEYRIVRNKTHLNRMLSETCFILCQDQRG